MKSVERSQKRECQKRENIPADPSTLFYNSLLRTSYTGIFFLMMLSGLTLQNDALTMWYLLYQGCQTHVYCMFILKGPNIVYIVYYIGLQLSHKFNYILAYCLFIVRNIFNSSG